MTKKANEIQTGYQKVRQEIENACQRVDRCPDSVKVVAVTKGYPPRMLIHALSAGLKTLGESRAQEFREKVGLLEGAEVEWHFVGPLQPKNAKLVAGPCHLIHSVDTLAVAQAVGERSVQLDRTSDILIQVNVSGEETKSGVPPEKARALAEDIVAVEGVSLRGFMTMAPFWDDQEAIRPLFRQLREIRDEIADHLAIELPELSMGMSNDFSVAVEEGATLVRVGTKIFGKREV